MSLQKSLVILVMSLILFDLPACTAKNNEFDEPKREGPVEIHFLSPFPRGLVETVVKKYVDAIAAFNGQHSTIHVVIDYPDGKLSKFNLMESDHAPDVVIWYPGELQEAKDRGILRDLNLYQFKDWGIPVQILDLGMIDGNQLVLPYSANPVRVHYNKALFDEAQLPYPDGEWTWDQYREISNTMVDHPSLLPYNILILDELLATMGTGILSPDGNKVIGYLDSPEAVRVIKWLNTWYRDEHRESPLDSSDVYKQFTHSNSGMMVDGLMAQYPEFAGDKKSLIGVAPFPNFDSSRKSKPINFSGYAIANKSKYPEEAWKLIEFLAVDVNEQSIQLARDYLPTSKPIADAVGMDIDELQYAFQESGNKNPFFYTIYFSDPSIERDFQHLLTVHDEEIPTLLYNLAARMELMFEKKREDEKNKKSQ